MWWEVALFTQVHATMPRHLLILLLGTIALASCKREPLFDPTQPESGKDFFPFAIGKAWIYAVDSIIYDPVGLNGPVDTVRCWTREVVRDTLPTPLGSSYILDRYVRYDTLQPWAYQHSFLVHDEPDRLLINEHNLTLVHALSPLYEGLTWDGTALIDPLMVIPIYGESMQPFKGWSFRVEDVGAALGVNQHWFEDVLSIRQADSENLLERRLSIEYYQRNVGLVFRVRFILDTQCGGNPADCAGIPWAEKAEKGYILRQVLIATE
jgi:hypothetical protein